MKLKDYKYEIIICAIVIVLTFVHNHSISLWDQDEAAYAGFAYQMNQTGNWLIPSFPWSEIHRKTPLHFWNIAISQKMFGFNEFATRFSSSLSILGVYALIFFWGAKFIGRKTALLSVAILSTSLFVPLIAKIAVTDATLLLFSTVCAFSLLEVFETGKWKYAILFWLSFALALLVKGPPIIIFTGIFGCLLLLFHPNRKNVIHLHPWFGLPLAILPLYLWGYKAWQVDQDFINWMIDWYILKRINSSVLGQTAPFGSHFLLMIGFFMLYLVFIPKAFIMGVRSRLKEMRFPFYLVLWFVAGWLIYEFSPSKLPAYVVTSHVPLAMLIALAINSIDFRKAVWKRSVALQLIIPILLTLGLLAAAYYFEMDISVLVIITVFVTLYVSVGLFFYIKKKTLGSTSNILTFNFLFLSLLFVFLLPRVDEMRNATKQVGMYLEQNLPLEKSTVVIGNHLGHPPSLPFYAMQHSSNTVFSNSLNELVNHYHSKDPVALILDQKQADFFYKNYLIHKLPFFESRLTDRPEKVKYYIVLNQAAMQLR